MKRTSSLPNNDDDHSDSGSEISVLDTADTYVIRVTPDDIDKFDYDNFKKLIRDYWPTFLIARETSPRVHFHIVLQSYFSSFNTREMFKSNIIYQIWKAPRPRGFGNKQWNFQEAEDPQKALSYAVKDHEYEYEGYDPDDISYAEQESFSKNKPSDFKQEFQQLNKDFQEDDTITQNEYMVRFISSKSKYGQMVNVSHAYQYSVSAMIRRDPSYAESVVDEFFSKKNF